MYKATKAAASLFFVLSLTACGDARGDGSNNGQDSTQTSTSLEAPYAEQEKADTFSARLAGKDFKILITRKADKSLPVVTDDMGKQYYDNRVDIIITRDGEDFFKNSYTKETFSEFLAKDESQGTVLLGMAFDQIKSDSHAIYLGSQVGQVGIEEGPAFSIEIPLDGSRERIVRDKNQDNTGDDGLGD